MHRVPHVGVIGKESSMNRKRLHLWFLANLALLLIAYLKIFILSQLVVVFMSLTLFIMKPAQEIKKTYTAKMSKKATILSLEEE